jgi:hypothetical protein
MAALVQTYPQQSSTVTMLQTRPSSASGILQSSSQPPVHHQYPANGSQRNSFHGMNNNMAVPNYRGHSSVAPIAPYAFTSTPNLALPNQRLQGGPHLRSEQRTTSAPIVPTLESGNANNRSRYPAAASVSTTSSSSSSDLSSLSQKSGSRDDSTIPATTRTNSGNPRPHSTIVTSASQNLAPPVVSSGKAAPDRYRRPNNRRAESSTSSPPANAQTAAIGSAMPNVMQFYGSSTQQTTTPAMASQGSPSQVTQSRQPLTFNPALGTAADDMQLNRHTAQEQAKRYRRRSIHTIEATDYTLEGAKSNAAGLQQQGSRQVSSANGRIDQQQQHPLRSSPIVTLRPATPHERNASSESVNSTRSSQHSRPSSVSLARVSHYPSSHIPYLNMSIDNPSQRIASIYPHQLNPVWHSDALTWI